MTTKRTIEVFRPGTFRPMSGEPITFSAGDLTQLAEDYDASAAPAPVVVGHPRHDSPAYGWVSGFSFSGDKLTADIGEMDPAFVEAVQAGRYKKISLSLFRPDAPNNPKPGQWYPKHVGFLGGAAPAVSGLKPVELADDDEAATFELADARAFKDVASALRRMRDFFIDQFGLEKADEVLPDYQIRWIDEAGDDPAPGPAYADPSHGNEDPDMPNPPASTPADTAVFAERQAALDRRQAALDERERKADHDANVAFADDLVDEGRLLPVSKDKVVGLLDSLSGAEPVSFTEKDAEVKAAPVDLLRDILKAQPKIVSFGAVDTGSDPDVGRSIEFAAPDGRAVDAEGLATHSRALAYQRAHPGTEYLDAVRAVEAGA